MTLPKNVLEAKLSGSKHYFTGLLCSKGHLDKRLTSDRSCISCGREKRAKQYLANPEKFRKQRQVAYIENADVEKAKAIIRSAEWRKNNPNHEGSRLSKRAYKKNNQSKTRAGTAKRRAAKLQRTPLWLTSDDHWMIEQAYELSALRTRIFGFPWHVDHVIPLQGKLVSGLHTPYNLQVIPAIENVSKANKYVPA